MGGEFDAVVDGTERGSGRKRGETKPEWCRGLVSRDERPGSLEARFCWLTLEYETTNASCLKEQVQVLDRINFTLIKSMRLSRADRFRI